MGAQRLGVGRSDVVPLAADGSDERAVLGLERVDVAVDVSNRPYLVYRVELANDRIGGFDASLTEDFLYAFSQNAGLDLHVELRYGKSPHHVVEAIFKGTARALRQALERDPRQPGLPTVKGAL